MSCVSRGDCELELAGDAISAILDPDFAPCSERPSHPASCAVKIKNAHKPKTAEEVIILLLDFIQRGYTPSPQNIQLSSSLKKTYITPSNQAQKPGP
jgi:6-phosphofructokinase|tara:strand:+ start:101 stop:391 length:291 start_codon:yes stop_codon:yes gene_type:complete